MSSLSYHINPNNTTSKTNDNNNDNININGLYFTYDKVTYRMLQIDMNNTL